MDNFDAYSKLAEAKSMLSEALDKVLSAMDDLECAAPVVKKGGGVMFAIGDVYAPRNGFMFGPYPEYDDVIKVPPYAIATEHEEDSVFIWKLLPNGGHQTVAVKRDNMWVPLLGKPSGG